MASFTYNRFSGENFSSQWENFRQKKSFNDDITNSIGQQTMDFSDIISGQTRDFQETLKSASANQVAAMEESTRDVCGSLNNGFNLLSDHLQNVSIGIGEVRSELNSIGSMLDWKLSCIIEYQRLSALLLGNISVLLRIPDIQKERQYHVEQGMKFLKNAFFDKDFYEDSLLNFLKAVNIEPTDFFALHRLGLIYMYSPKSDIEKAEEYFKKAAKYAVAETNSGAIITHNYLADNIGQSLLDQAPTIDTIKLQAAESYLFAGRCCYIQGKMDEAAELAGKGFGLVPLLVEAGFTQAKALAANNNETKASIVLEKVINIDRFYSLKTLEDFDLCPKPEIKSLLKKLQKEATNQANLLIRNCKAQMIDCSNSIDYIAMISSLVNESTYLTSKKAIDLINKINVWNYCEPFKNSNQSSQLDVLVKTINSIFNIQYYKKKESLQYTKIDAYFIDTFINNVTKETQWIFPSSSQINNNPNWTREIKSKEISASVVQFIVAEKSLEDDLQNVNIKFKDLLHQYENENTSHLNFLENERIKTENERIRVENERIKAINKLEQARKDADDENLATSRGKGIIGGIIGLIVGLIGGGIISWIIWGILKIFGLDIGNVGTNLILLAICALCVYIGFEVNFHDTRSKK